MNYYERHLGDYAKDTAHLSMLEHGAYGLLLDRYYATEAGIPADQAHRVARARSKEEKAAVDGVLAEFFTLTDGVWTKGRVQEEIVKAAAKINAAKENGKKGGRPKNPEQTQPKPGGLFLGSENETQTKALQSPVSSLHKKNTSGSGEPAGFQAFWNSWPVSKRKGSRAKCLERWMAKRFESQSEAILAHVAAMKASSDWVKDKGQFIPAPLSYLGKVAWDGAELDERRETIFAGGV